MTKRVVEFVRQKDFKFVREIGQGGTGRTVLLEDELIDEMFVCKKYSPYVDEYKYLFFNNFKDEIKLLHLLNHKNIVRVFNYYLYPEFYTGYILMEFIKGKNIYDYISENPDKLNDIFKQVIDGFVHLEQSGILHRDIRPDNILVSDDGLVKIIDFGFSKKINYENDFAKSIELNWKYSLPADFSENIYDFKTEIYFVGKLFEELIRNHMLSDFLYKETLHSMIEMDYTNRVESFFNIQRDISESFSITEAFTEDEKEIYQTFANELERIIVHLTDTTSYKSDTSEIIRNLGNICRNSILENYIQNNGKLILCFTSGGFSFSDRQIVQVETVYQFYKFLTSSSQERQKTILNHIWQRLDKLERHDTDIPF